MVEHDGDFCSYCGGTLKIQQVARQQDNLLSDNEKPDRELCENNDTTMVKKKIVNTMDKESIVSKFFSYNGTINRRTFAIRWLLQTFILVIITASMAGKISKTGDTFAALLFCIIVFICLFSEVSLEVRRLRHIGKRGGWMFCLIVLGMLPIIGIFVLGYELFVKGEDKRA